MKEYVKCQICGKEFTNNNSYAGSHIKRVHNISLYEYIRKYYKWGNPEFKFDKCGFCDKDAIPHFEADHKNLTYILSYKNGYLCGSDECKEITSQIIFNSPYDKKTFEHIGSNSKYLSLRYKKDINDVNFKKSKGFRESKFSTSLSGFIEKYGEDIGKKKYEERNKKISKSFSESWYIEKYGEKEGKQKWGNYINKIPKRYGKSKSKASEKIGEILKEGLIDFKTEFPYKNSKDKKGLIDFYLPEHNTIIEFYGDFWHCNPNTFKIDYYHKVLKKFAYEIWEKDKNRIDFIYNNIFKKNINILIIWESTKFSNEYLLNLLNSIRGKNIILEI